MAQNLLNWKLDIINPTYSRQYNAQFKKFLLFQTKMALVVIGIGIIFLPVIELIINHTAIIDFEVWNPIYFMMLWAALWMPVFLWKRTKHRLSLWVSICTCGLSYLVTISNLITTKNYLFNEQGYHVSLIALVMPLVLRLRNIYVLLLMCGATLFQMIATLVIQRNDPWHLQIGYLIPNLSSMALAFYCGYFLERRVKYDFLRRKLMDFESQKLGWIVARDASLLRNIFPKNLSDELELQMSNRQKATPTTHGKAANRLPRRGNSNPALANHLPRRNNSNPALVNRQNPTAFLMKAMSGKSVSRDQKELQQIDKNSRPESITIQVESKSTDALTVEDVSSLPSQILTPVSPIPLTNVTPRLKDLKTPLTNRDLQPPPSRDRFTSLSITIPSQVETATGDSPPSSPIFSIPPVVNSPLASPRSETDLPALVHSARYLTSAGTPLRTGHGPELHTFLSGAQHSDGSLIALSHSYPNVVVIFADIVGFTSLSSCISPQELVQLLNKLFSMFDDIMDKHNMEKIRTVGDAYLCVANMSRPLEAPEETAVIVAQKMIAAVTNIKDKQLSLRVGIASGPCIAGVTGIMKWNYDIFGKPYADATFMETCCLPNCISVTNSVYQPCKDNKRFFFEQLNVQRDEETIERYFIDTNNDTKGGGFGEPLIIQFRDDPLGLRDRNEGLAVLARPEFIKQGIELMDSQLLDADSDSSSEVSLSEFQFDLGFKFGYTKEELLEEEQHIKKAKLNFLNLKFRIPSFEIEFLRYAAEKTYGYTTGVVVVFIVAAFLFLVAELLDANPGPSTLPTWTWIIFALVFADLGGYLAFHHFFDFLRYSHLVAAAALFLFNFAFVMLAYVSDTTTHYTWTFFVMFYTSSFARVQGMWIIVIQTIITIVSSALGYGESNNLKFPTRHFATLVLILSFTLVTQYAIVKSFRMEFLAQKRVRFDTFHQKVAQYRAKLLLHNILPEEIIPRLQPSNDKEKGTVNVVDIFEEATMMFVNLTNLEELTADLDAASTFQVYNEIFTMFDEATRALGLEKIKTINTVYMVASGLPKKIDNHAEAAINLAKEFYHITSKYTYPLIKKKLRVRIGIASGPVVAGIIGKKKYSYDCWSDTTNTASRMESNGWNGYAQITPAVYKLVHSKFDFQKRENVAIKGKGSMDTYVLKLRSNNNNKVA